MNYNTYFEKRVRFEFEYWRQTHKVDADFFCTEFCPFGHECGDGVLYHFCPTRKRMKKLEIKQKKFETFYVKFLTLKYKIKKFFKK